MTVSNSHRVEVSCAGSVSLITVDKTHGCTLSLTEGSAGADVVSNASAQLFVVLPEEQVSDLVRNSKFSSSLWS